LIVSISAHLANHTAKSLSEHAQNVAALETTIPRNCGPSSKRASCFTRLHPSRLGPGDATAIAKSHVRS
jgi:hypothetical protein